jgi:hypothetical protein
MIDRQQVNLRLERELIDALDDLARTDHVDRTEVARRLLVDGVQRSRVERALRDYSQGRVTAWRAARDAGISLYEMLDRIHEAGIPYELDPQVLTRIDARLERSPEAARSSRIAERSEPYSGAGTSDADTGIDDLRTRYRPERVEILFVGESSPAQGTHFYRANSNLYRATRAAFAAAYGDDNVPRGEAFLRYFRDHGCWLVDLADSPVNRLGPTERRGAVERGIARLAELLKQTSPPQVIAVKRDIADFVRRAQSLTGADTELTALPFPVRQWTADYVRGLAGVLGGNRAPGAPPNKRRSSGRPTARSVPKAINLLQSLKGKTLQTLTHGKPNEILAVERNRFLVATDTSPSGAWEDISIIQEAMDRLFEEGELEITKRSLGHRRTALVGAVLSRIPGVEVVSTSPRVLAVTQSPRIRR